MNRWVGGGGNFTPVFSKPSNNNYSEIFMNFKFHTKFSQDNDQRAARGVQIGPSKYLTDFEHIRFYVILFRIKNSIIRIYILVVY